MQSIRDISRLGWQLLDRVFKLELAKDYARVLRSAVNAPLRRKNGASA